jgi:hypothetical protein
MPSVDYYYMSTCTQPVWFFCCCACAESQVRYPKVPQVQKDKKKEKSIPCLIAFAFDYYYLSMPLFDWREIVLERFISKLGYEILFVLVVLGGGTFGQNAAPNKNSNKKIR